jgi:hypothetical protein
MRTDLLMIIVRGIEGHNISSSSVITTEGQYKRTEYWLLGLFLFSNRRVA